MKLNKMSMSENRKAVFEGTSGIWIKTSGKGGTDRVRTGVWKV